MGDGGLALQSRLAEEGSKPPRGALAEDRGLERRWKRRGRGSRQVWTGKMSDGREFSVVDVSKLVSEDIKTGAGSALREESGGYPLTAQVVSGIQAA
jgi:hypothetical protein